MCTFTWVKPQHHVHVHVHVNGINGTLMATCKYTCTCYVTTALMSPWP